MNPDIRRSLAAPGDDFTRAVWPLIAPLIGGGTPHSVESTVDGSTSRWLDLLAGIDALQLLPDRARGIAVRLQERPRGVHDAYPYDTFSVRVGRGTGHESELGKRIAAIRAPKEGNLWPCWTVQAYLSSYGGTVESVAVARTRELMQYLDQGEEGTHYARRQFTSGGRATSFLTVPWRTYACRAAEVIGAEPFLRVWRQPEAAAD